MSQHLPLNRPVRPQARAAGPSQGKPETAGAAKTSRRRRLLRLGVIVCVALGAVQFAHWSLRAGGGQAEAGSIRPDLSTLDASGAAVASLAGDALVPSVPVARHPRADTAPPAASATTGAVPPDCQDTLRLTRLPGAVLFLQLAAPCHPAQRATLSHAGLSFDLQTDTSGALALSLPALAADGVVQVAFSDGRTLTSALPLPDMTGLHRLAVQGRPGAVFTLHGPVAADPATGGWLARLGDPTLEAPLLAQIYTFPAGPMVDIAIESPVGPQSCGREVRGRALTSLDGAVSIAELSLAMPPCGGPTGYLVLKNPPQDMKIAAND